ncbi:hypothetical protein C6Y62_01060 [Hyphomicrobium sulfonivorans]|nr:hypothetical protein [Hyphomicrobium sulfonivorans]
MLHARGYRECTKKEALWPFDGLFLGHTQPPTNRPNREDLMLRIYHTALALFILATPAAACVESAGQANGAYQIGTAGWGEADAQFKTEGTDAIFTPQVGTQTARWNAGLETKSVDACATIAMPSSTGDASRSYAGLLFWATDKDNFYQAVISPNGMFTVARKIAGRIVPTPPVNWGQVSTLKLGPNEKNTLRVATDGETVAVSINGTVVARFRGQAPEGMSHVGLVASSAPTGVDTWRISDFKVADPQAQVSANAAADQQAQSSGAHDHLITGAIASAPVAPGCGTGKVLFDEPFTVHDPNWGEKDDQFSIGDGKATFTPPSGLPALRWNRVFVFGDIDTCVNFELANNTANATTSYAGLVFWAEDSRNYFQAVLAPNGYFTVARIADGKAVAKRPVPWTKVAAANAGSKKTNTMRLKIVGNAVTVEINGKPAGSFKTEAPRWPSHIGLLAASAESKEGDTWMVSDLRVTAP